MAGKIKIWLWISVAMAIGGAVLLFPIGTVIWNVLFILVKAGMIAGLMLLLFMRKKSGFYLWSFFCAGAVAMTVVKWSIMGHASILIIVSICVDVLMPVVAYALMRPEMDKFK